MKPKTGTHDHFLLYLFFFISLQYEARIDQRIWEFRCGGKFPAPETWQVTHVAGKMLWEDTTWPRTANSKQHTRTDE